MCETLSAVAARSATLRSALFAKTFTFGCWDIFLQDPNYAMCIFQPGGFIFDQSLIFVILVPFFFANLFEQVLRSPQQFSNVALCHLQWVWMWSSKPSLAQARLPLSALAFSSNWITACWSARLWCWRPLVSWHSKLRRWCEPWVTISRLRSMPV